MKSVLLLAFAFLTLNALAGPGDTLDIKAHQDVVIKTNPSVGHTDYPVWVDFPDVNTRIYKLYAYLTFECAPGLKCGEWDYINYINVGKVGGVNGTDLNWEIARYITPYGFYWDSQSGWEHGYYYDLTDFSSLLRDSIEIIYRHTGYESNTDRGWKINLTFYAVEGDPYQEVVDINPVWKGSFKYGNPSDPIEDHLDQRSVTLNAQSEAASLKIIQTGHGFGDGQNCAEFCPKMRTVKMDGATINQHLVWKDCGFNALYPQAGTWLYDRTNWCPGSKVNPQDVYLGSLGGGSTHTLDIDMQPYTSSDLSHPANYVFTTYLTEYKSPAYQHDVSLESVIAPSEEYQSLRFNPICGTPILEIRNNGSDPLTSLTVEWGIPGGNKSTYNWTGNLGFKETDTVYISQSVDWVGFNGQLSFELKNPNGQPDEFPYNNSRTVHVVEPPTISGSGIILFFKTNKAASENYYLVRNMEDGSVVYSRNNLQNEKLYWDTIPLPSALCYQLEFYDDGPFTTGLPQLNEDGLSWWANPDDGTGFVKVLGGQGGIVKSFEPDFGEKILFQFRVDNSLGQSSPNVESANLDVFPSPAKDHLNVHFELKEAPSYVELVDINGKEVARKFTDKSIDMLQFDVSQLPRGIYLVRLGGASDLLVRKVIIQ